MTKRFYIKVEDENGKVIKKESPNLFGVFDAIRIAHRNNDEFKLTITKE